MDILEKLERLSGNTPLEKKKLAELIEETFENAMMSLEHLEIINVVAADKKNKIRRIRQDLQKLKFDVLDDLENIK